MVQVKYPEELAQFGSLFVEKTQFPLNLMQVSHELCGNIWSWCSWNILYKNFKRYFSKMGEEESRAWQRGANSDASLRPFGKCLRRHRSRPVIVIELWAPKTWSHWAITICSGPPGKRPPSPTGGRGRGRGRGSSMPYYDRYDYNQAHICLFLIFRHFELWPEMSLRSITVNHSSRNRSMDDDLEGRAREREAPSAERGFPKTLFFFKQIFGSVLES